MKGLDFRALKVSVRMLRLFSVGFETLTLPRTVKVFGRLDGRRRGEVLSMGFNAAF